MLSHPVDAFKAAISESFQASFQNMHPNLVGVLVSAEIILLLSSWNSSATRGENYLKKRSSQVQRRTVRRVRLDCCKERFGELSCFMRQVWMDEPFRHQAMAGAEQTDRSGRRRLENLGLDAHFQHANSLI